MYNSRSLVLLTITLLTYHVVWKRHGFIVALVQVCTNLNIFSIMVTFLVRTKFMASRANDKGALIFYLHLKEASLPWPTKNMSNWKYVHMCTYFRDLLSNWYIFLKPCNQVKYTKRTRMLLAHGSCQILQRNSPFSTCITNKNLLHGKAYDQLSQKM